MSGLPEGVHGGAGWLPALCGGPCLAGLTLSSFYCSISSLCTQCGAADCVLIFLGASACTAPKFYIFTEANLCVLSLVQCAAQHRHQTILMWVQINPEQTKWNQNVLQIKTKTISFSSHTYQNFLNASMNP